MSKNIGNGVEAIIDALEKESAGGSVNPDEVVEALARTLVAAVRARGDCNCFEYKIDGNHLKLTIGN